MEFREVFIKIYALHRLGAISFSIICMDDYIDWDVPKKTGFGNSTFLMTTKWDIHEMDDNWWNVSRACQQLYSNWGLISFTKFEYRI